MKFMLSSPWPIGGTCLEAGVTIDFDKAEAEWGEAERLANGRVPSASAVIPLDDEARELIEWTAPRRSHPSRDALPPALRDYEFRLDGNRCVAWRRKTTEKENVK